MIVLDTHIWVNWILAVKLPSRQRLWMPCGKKAACLSQRFPDLKYLC